MTSHGTPDPADRIGFVAAANWRRLLRIHHHRLRHSELEDCLGQATLELLTAAKRGQHFLTDQAALAALATRFESRIIDRQRALGGRSPIMAAAARAASTDTIEDTVAATGVDPVARVLAREELARLTLAIGQLTRDQRLVILHQLRGTERPSLFCERNGWTVAKYRKTAQRARARLRGLLR